MSRQFYFGDDTLYFVIIKDDVIILYIANKNLDSIVEHVELRPIYDN